MHKVLQFTPVRTFPVLRDSIKLRTGLTAMGLPPEHIDAAVLGYQIGMAMQDSDLQFGVGAFEEFEPIIRANLKAVCECVTGEFEFGGITQVQTKEFALHFECQRCGAKVRVTHVTTRQLTW